MLFGLLAASLAHADCPAAARSADLVAAVGRAEIAFASMDDGAFGAATAEAREDLTCLGEPLTTSDAAAYHRMEALAAFLAGKHDATIDHFAAAHTLQPGYQLPTSVAPEQHPLRTDWTAASQRGASPLSPLPAAPEGVKWVQIDGARAADVPGDRPFVYQQFADDGHVLLTQLLADPSALPAGAVVAEKPHKTRPDKPNKPKGGRIAGAVILGAAAAGCVAGTGIALQQSKVHENEFWDPRTPPDQLPKERKMTNTLVWTGVGLGAGAVGLTVGALVTVPW